MSEALYFNGLPNKFTVIRQAFVRVCDDAFFRARLWNKWLPAATWVEAIGKSGFIDINLFVVTIKDFNSAMGKAKLEFNGHLFDRFDTVNDQGIFRVKFHKQWYYYVTDPKKQALYPCPLDVAWKEKVSTDASLVLFARPTRLSTQRPSTFHSDEVAPPPNKRSRTTMTTTTVTTAPVEEEEQGQEDQQEETGEEETPRGTPPPIAATTAVFTDSTSYWNSRDARKLFGSTVSGDSEGSLTIDDVKLILELHVVKLCQGNKHKDGWRHVVQGRD
jgi:hypothetical protein